MWFAFVSRAGAHVPECQFFLLGSGAVLHCVFVFARAAGGVSDNLSIFVSGAGAVLLCLLLLPGICACFLVGGYVRGVCGECAGSVWGACLCADS